MKDARRLLDYRRDLLDPQLAEDFERELAHLEAVLRKGVGGDELEKQILRVDELCAKANASSDEGSLRDNFEVFLVAVVIALAVRTYFLQPFTIPTGSMQPTLNGIQAHRTEAPAPSLPIRILDGALHGRTFVDVVATDAEKVTEISEEPRIFLFHRLPLFVQTRIMTSKGHVYWASVPLESIRNLFPPDILERTYSPGEAIVRGTIDAGDHVLVDKFTYNFCSPHRSDVFVFVTKGIAGISAQTTQYYIKRLAGVPGDVLRIESPDLFLNGSKATALGFRRVMSGTFEAPHLGYQGYSNRGKLGDGRSTVELGKDEYFALGDNSYSSFDSRFWGPVPGRNVTGRAVFVFWPFTAHWGQIE